MTTKTKNSLSKINLYLDIVLVVGFLITMEEKLTDEALHEWLGVALGISLMAHLLLHWNWIMAVTKRFFQKIPRPARINYILNIALFIAFTMIIFSGLMISKVVVGTFGLAGSDDPFWKILHTMSSNVVLLLVGMHIALHWRWVVNAFKRYLLSPVQRYFGGQPTPRLTSPLTIKK